MTSSADSSAPVPALARLSVYVGHGNATGDIDRFDLDAATGELTPRETFATGSSTSYLAFHPNGRFAYTTQNRSSRLSALGIDAASGRLSRIGDVAVPPRPGETEAGPAYVTVDRSGRFLLAANYRGHNAVVYPLRADGGIDPLVANVSAGNHAHSVVLSPDNRAAFVPHLGADLVAHYRFDGNTGALTPADPAASPTAKGAGPRHLTFAPNGRHAFVINELDATLIGYDYDAERGTLRERFCVPTLPADYDGRRWAADVRIHPNGRWLYASNRAHESVALFELDPAGGAPRLAGRVGSGGKTPRNFTLDPAGRFLFVANQDSGNLITFAIDQASGQLTPIADRGVGEAPYYVVVLPLP